MPTAQDNYIGLMMLYAQSDEIPTPFDMPRPLKIRGPRYKPLDAIPKIGDQQEFITRDQVRLILGGISLMTVARLDRSGKLKGVQLNKITKSTEYHSTSKKLYRKADVIAYADKLRKERRKAV
jgi:hypothetical protein